MILRPTIYAHLYLVSIASPKLATSILDTHNSDIHCAIYILDFDETGFRIGITCGEEIVVPAYATKVS
jgi:hypothetical protein